MIGNFDSEQELAAFEKKMRKWKRWSKHQPAGGGLAFDEWLKENPSMGTRVAQRTFEKPNAFRPIMPSQDYEE